MARFATPPGREQYHEEVWDLVRRIPAGRVSTYGRIAALAAPPAGMDPAAYRAFGARWVGGAMAHCPDDVPWWRVINAQGRISPRDSSAEQRARLEREGVVFDARGRIALAEFVWDGD
jgi:methylated-DNA-protein-cysteine methyltransferase-like protein